MESYICNQFEGIKASDVFVTGDNSSFGIQAQFGVKTIQLSSCIRYKCRGIWPYLYVGIDYLDERYRARDYRMQFPDIRNYENTIPVIIEMILKILNKEPHENWEVVKTENGYELKQI
jgi:hypothetical protein